MSVEIDIPGGKATILNSKELTPRRRRPLEIADTLNLPLFSKIREARRVISPSGEVEEHPGLWGPDLELTERDAELLTGYQDKKILSRLSAWTLDLPLPKTTDDLLDVPADVYDALSLGVNEVERAEAGNPFVVSEENLDNPESPTGASAD